MVFSIQQQALRGNPDLLLCVNGQFMALELKSSEKAKVSELQNYYLDRVSEAGGISWVVYPENWEAVKTGIEMFVKEEFDHDLISEREKK